MIDTFQMFARYNRWANQRLYDAASGLSNEDYNRDAGVFFKSMNGTLNHILVADLLWVGRFENVDWRPSGLDAILHKEFAPLRKQREEMDDRIVAWVDGLSADDVAGDFSYTPMESDDVITKKLGPIVSHVFNHQTHHRGQAHAILTQLTGEAPSMDLLYYQIAEQA